MTTHRTYPNNLPIALSSFIGRGREIVAVRRLLADARLGTLTGPGGCGKTRLALWVAAELGEAFEDGAWLVELASLSDPGLVPQTAATALGVREQSGQTMTETLAGYLQPRQVLLVLDNCEHLVDACARLAAALLQTCPGLTILATSREPLGVPGEAVWTVPPLSLPDPQPGRSPTDLATHEGSEAVRLFVARAAAAAAGFSLTAENAGWVAEICRRLDGMPLAIELAAARVRALSVQQIAERLDDRFHLLMAGSRTAPPRQQTLAATLDWSYALLSEPEQAVLQRLSVFAGGCALEAAEAVCGEEEGSPSSDPPLVTGEGALRRRDVLDLLTRLVDKSLVLVDGSQEGGVRYRLLETIRQYASHRLDEAGEGDRTRDRHLGYILQWASGTQLFGPGQLEELNRFEIEHDNVRAALAWSQTPRAQDGPALGLKLAALSAPFWFLHSYLSEGRAHLASALAQAEGRPSLDQPRAQALHWAANLAYLQSDFPASRPLCEESLRLWRGLGPAFRSEMAYTLNLLGVVITEVGDYTTALLLSEEALAVWRDLKDVPGMVEALMQLGWVAMRTGNYEQARTRLEETLVLGQETGYTSRAFTLSALGEVAVRQGRYEDAARHLEESAAMWREHGHKWGLGTVLGSLGWAALRQRDFKHMRMLLAESLALRMETGDRSGIAWCLEKLAEAAFIQARSVPAADPQETLRRAVYVFGAAAALRAPLRSVIDLADRPDYERTLAALRAALGAEAFDAAWAEGSALTMAQAVEIALSELAQAAVEAPATSPQTDKEKFGGLTGRERQVAALIAQGRSNREIADALVVSIRTVETYVTRILDKLGVDSRVQIATWAMEKGLTTSPQT